MRRLLSLVLPLVPLLSSPLRAGDADDFAGVWQGTLTAPDRTTAIGVAFTRTEQGLLASLFFPEMFVYNVNFGPAAIRDGVFHLPALDLTLRREGDALAGTLAAPRLPVKLHRGTAFAPEPPEPEYPAPPAPAWTHPLGAPAWASPVAREGIVYVGTTDGAFHAVRADDGREAWTWHGTVPLYGEALVTDELVCFVDARSELVALDRTDGSFVWRAPLHEATLAGRAVPADETFTHRTAAPVIDARGILYVGSTDGGLYALRARTGRVLWRHPAGAPIHAAVALQGDSLVAGCLDGSVFVLNRRTRRETLRVKLGGPVVSTPVIAGDTLVVGARDALLYGLSLARGAVMWRDSYWFSWVESTPRLAGGTLYAGGSDFRRVSALSPADGRFLWSTDVLGLAWGTPVVENDTVFAGTAGQHRAGTVIRHAGGIVALDRRTGAVKWRFAAPVPAGAEMSGYAGSLVLAGDKIVGAGLDGTLVAFVSAAPAATPAR